jgi:2-aminoadipate transaminase
MISQDKSYEIYDKGRKETIMENYPFSTMAGRMRRSEIRELLKLTRLPETISFGGGLPDPAIFPYDAVRAAATRAIDERGRLALQYSPTEGEPFLKEQLAAFMIRHGESNIDPQNTLVVSSSQQGLDLLGKVFIDPGDPIIVERPTYIGALQAFRAFDADFQGVEMDDCGIVPAEVEKIVMRLGDRGRKPKFIYVIPDFQNPSGITLSLERRKELLEIAAKYDLLIIEDSPYGELRFAGEPLPSLLSMDSDGRVLQMKTFSKIFCPGLRLGWIVGPSPVIDKLVVAKQGTDLCTSAFVSIVAGYLLADGHVDRQIEIARNLYRRKRTVMLDSLEKLMPQGEGVSWSKPEGGMFLWLRLPEYMDATEMIAEAVEQKVAYVIGSGFFHDGSGKNTMRLNYSYPTEEQIVRGIGRLSRIIKKRLHVPIA